MDLDQYLEIMNPITTFIWIRDEHVLIVPENVAHISYNTAIGLEKCIIKALVHMGRKMSNMSYYSYKISDLGPISAKSEYVPIWYICAILP